MDHDNINADGAEKKTSLPSNDEYKVGANTIGEQFLFGIKMFAIGGIFFFFFWLVEKLHLYF